MDLATPPYGTGTIPAEACYRRYRMIHYRNQRDATHVRMDSTPRQYQDIKNGIGQKRMPYLLVTELEMDIDRQPSISSEDAKKSLLDRSIAQAFASTPKESSTGFGRFCEVVLYATNFSTLPNKITHLAGRSHVLQPQAAAGSRLDLATLNRC